MTHQRHDKCYVVAAFKKHWRTNYDSFFVESTTDIKIKRKKERMEKSRTNKNHKWMPISTIYHAHF